MSSLDSLDTITCLNPTLNPLALVQNNINYGGSYYQPGLVPPGMGMQKGGRIMPGRVPYGTPYAGNSMRMSGLGSAYGGPIVNPYPPTIAQTQPVFADRGSLYRREPYDRDRRYNDDHYLPLYGNETYDRDHRYDDDHYRSRRYGDNYRYRSSSPRASSRSMRRDYGDYHSRDYDRRYSRDGYGRDYRDRSRSPYPSSPHHYCSSSSGRRNEKLTIRLMPDGSIKLLHDGEELPDDRARRERGKLPKGVDVRTNGGKRGVLWGSHQSSIHSQ